MTNTVHYGPGPAVSAETALSRRLSHATCSARTQAGARKLATAMATPMAAARPLKVEGTRALRSLSGTVGSQGLIK